MLKLILIVLVVLGMIAVMHSFAPVYMVKQAFEVGGVAISWGLLGGVGALVIAVKNIA